MAGQQMNIRRESSKPLGPPQVGVNEVIVDEQGQLFYRDKAGKVVPLRPYTLAVGQFVQDGGATIPTGSWRLNELGAGGVWARASAGIYTFTFATAVLNTSFGMVFVSMEGSSAAKLIRVDITSTTVLTVRTEDAAGAAVEANCTFNVLVYNFTALVT